MKKMKKKKKKKKKMKKYIAMCIQDGRKNIN